MDQETADLRVATALSLRAVRVAIEDALTELDFILREAPSSGDHHLVDVASRLERLWASELSTTAKRADLTFVGWEQVEGVPDGAEGARQLYFLLGEALRNAARHSNATKVVVRATVADAYFTAEVEDDGMGFQTDAVRDRGHGLSVMEYRANQIGGRVEVRSKPGQGTCVSCTAPLQR